MLASTVSRIEQGGNINSFALLKKQVSQNEKQTVHKTFK